MKLSAVLSADTCTCRHRPTCDHGCHASQMVLGSRIEAEYPADLVGRTVNGCDDCTPGLGLAHVVGCYAGDPFEVPIGTPEYA
jgi:hypothetical protein